MKQAPCLKPEFEAVRAVPENINMLKLLPFQT